MCVCVRRTRTHTHTLPLSTSLCENKQAMSWVAQGQTPADNKAIHPPRALLLLPLHRRKRSAHSSQGVGGVHSASTHATVAVLSISLLRVFPSQHTHTLSISLLRVFHPPPTHTHTHSLCFVLLCLLLHRADCGWEGCKGEAGSKPATKSRHGCGLCQGRGSTTA